MIFGITVFVLSFWASEARETKAANYEFLEVYLDVDTSACVTCGNGILEGAEV